MKFLEKTIKYIKEKYKKLKPKTKKSPRESQELQQQQQQPQNSQDSSVVSQTGGNVEFKERRPVSWREVAVIGGIVFVALAFIIEFIHMYQIERAKKIAVVMKVCFYFIDYRKGKSGS